ncbi:LCP family protein [Streptomyces sp. BI20]|uniref:LCP family protein n=1 Tax=Streptomyces sp. BI20 TaxID=3403460 RepID=UPI003C75A901
MDAQNRERGGEIDPADQWVRNPDTGNYELRPDHSPAQQQVPAFPPHGSPAPPPDPLAPPAVPGPRSRRGRPAEEQPPPQGRRAKRSAGRRGAAPADAPPAPDPAVPGPRRSRRGGAPAPEAATRAERRAAGKGAAPDPDPGASGRGRGRKAAVGTAATARRRRRRRIAGGVTAFVVVGGALGSYLYVQHLNGNIDGKDIGDAGTGGFQSGRPINLLVLGTDKRTGEGNEGYGDPESVGHADTTLLLHVSEDRTNATVLSIPRDLITDVPDCPTVQPDGSTKVIPGTRKVRFNTSLGQDGRDPGCTMRTVTQITGIPIDNFMMADFNAIKTLSTAVGGVPVCVAKDVDDVKSGLKLTKGEHRIEGEQALAFVRTRHAFGLESDLDRIKTQQAFLASLMREMKSSDTLTSPKKMFGLAEAATQALTVDKGLASVGKLVSLGGELRGVNPKNMTFTTLPVYDNPADKNTVLIRKDAADPLIKMIRDDVSLTKARAEADAKKEAEEAARLQGGRAPAASVRVDIRNAGGPLGAAQVTLDWLTTNKGLRLMSNQGNAAERLERTTLEYGADQADQARALADMLKLPASALNPSAENAGPRTPMRLSLGRDFDKPGDPLTEKPENTDGVQRVEADKATCVK